MSSGGYEKLLVYRLAVIIYDLTDSFCQKFLSSPEHRRTVEQMHHAARSGKQNIVEGSLENSAASGMTLTGVARASFGELLEDYKDFLRSKKLSVWEKTDPRVMAIRAIKDEPGSADTIYKPYLSYVTDPESLANLMITLCYKEGYLLDQLLRAQEAKFVAEGGFRENLFKKRSEYLKSQKKTY